MSSRNAVKNFLHIKGVSLPFPESSTPSSKFQCHWYFFLTVLQVMWWIKIIRLKRPFLLVNICETMDTKQVLSQHLQYHLPPLPQHWAPPTLHETALLNTHCTYPDVHSLPRYVCFLPIKITAAKLYNNVSVYAFSLWTHIWHYEKSIEARRDCIKENVYKKCGQSDRFWTVSVWAVISRVSDKCWLPCFFFPGQTLDDVLSTKKRLLFLVQQHRHSKFFLTTLWNYNM